ncbi:MAG: Uma2 family endonuclease [Akkermansiaceae bacterium]|nr:Uma2 family endonuclease [Armatimonadota bacterium]
MPTLLEPPPVTTHKDLVHSNGMRGRGAAGYGALRPGEAFALYGVSFETFLRLSKELEGSPRLAYDDRVLELRMPSEAHEELNRIIALLVALVLGEWRREVRDLGSMTHKDAATERGFEPDTCFYAVETSDNGGTRSVPLLAVEMEVTNDAVDKMPLYAAFGMPEVWRLALSGTGEVRVRYFVLTDSSYTEETESVVLAPLTTETLRGFLSARLTATQGFGDWIHSVQDWARQNRPEVAG